METGQFPPTPPTSVGIPHCPTMAALLGTSMAMQRVRALVGRLCHAEAMVLIRGESGTGKEMVAQALHSCGKREEEPFVAVNCAAISPGLVESEIFGHERGAFTDAVGRRLGRLETAGAGTLLLDEIAELTPDLQAKLLRVLETRRFQRVGSTGTEELFLRARVIAATHQDLEGRIAEGRFREDLYYRLNVVTIALPSLRDRAEDVPLLVLHFLRQQRRPLRLSPEAMSWLQRRPWPGNVRELRNAIERLALLADDDHVQVKALERIIPPRLLREGPQLKDMERLARQILCSETQAPGPKNVIENRLARMEQLMVRMAMDLCGHNRVRAARLLGVGRKALERRWQRILQGGPEIMPEPEDDD